MRRKVAARKLCVLQPVAQTRSSFDADLGLPLGDASSMCNEVETACVKLSEGHPYIRQQAARTIYQSLFRKEKDPQSLSAFMAKLDHCRLLRFLFHSCVDKT